MGNHLDAVGNACSTSYSPRKEQWHRASLVFITRAINQQQLSMPLRVPGTMRPAIVHPQASSKLECLQALWLPAQGSQVYQIKMQDIQLNLNFIKEYFFSMCWMQYL